MRPPAAKKNTIGPTISHESSQKVRRKKRSTCNVRGTRPNHNTARICLCAFKSISCFFCANAISSSIRWLSSPRSVNGRTFATRSTI